ncbi:unnamed protein product, partial [Polarella glacialis]
AIQTLIQPMKKHNTGPLGAKPKEKKAKDPSCRKIQIQRGNAGPLGAKPTEKKAKEPDCRETLIQPMKERGNAGPQRAKPKEKKAKDAEAEELQELPLEEEELDEFFLTLFGLYSSSHDNRGRPLMNNMDLRRFLQDFVPAEYTNKALGRADFMYDEEIERQQDLSFAYDLSKGEASRGLTMKAFNLCLHKLKLPKRSKDMAEKWFWCYLDLLTLFLKRFRFVVICCVFVFFHLFCTLSNWKAMPQKELRQEEPRKLPRTCSKTCVGTGRREIPEPFVFI